MSTLLFKNSGIAVQNHDATVGFTSDPVEFQNSHDWSVSITGVGTNGLPLFTIQCSNDNVRWYDYSLNATNVLITDSFEAEYFGYRYMRLVYIATGVTLGTINAMYTINNDNLSR